MQICNPLTSAELDQVVEAMQVTPGLGVVDFACGYGELLYRCAAVAEIRGTGVDLSPWMIAAAARSTDTRSGGSTLQWVLGEASDFHPDHGYDRAVCIGAEWVWHDFGGTARALAQRLRPGGVAVIGAARLHTDANAGQVRSERGAVETIDDQAALLGRHGFEPVHRVDPDDAGWDAYLERTRLAAQVWATRYPGAASDRWLEEQADWQAARERDREVIGWSVWIARRSPKVSSSSSDPA